MNREIGRKKETTTPSEIETMNLILLYQKYALIETNLPTLPLMPSFYLEINLDN